MVFRRLAILTLTTGLIAAAGARPAAATDQTAVMATVHRFMDSFNKGDTNAGLATCASPVSVVDEFPPHEWQGPTACADWANAYNANATAHGITGGFVTLKTPWHVNITGDRAYVVVPADYAYKQHGRPVLESGSIWTVALRKTAAGWRITGWAWARH
jgi:ketosteroid isomerase-like protein